MRLIDADYLKRMFDVACGTNRELFNIADSVYNFAIKTIDDAPTVEQDTLITEIIEELESRKDYGTEYAQAMEDVIVILKAKFGGGKQ